MEKQNNKLIAVSYQLYTVGEGGDELVEVASESKPFEFISGFGTTLPRFEEEIVKLEKSATFDFQLTKDEAYGDFMPERVLDLDKECSRSMVILTTTTSRLMPLSLFRTKTATIF